MSFYSVEGRSHGVIFINRKEVFMEKVTVRDLLEAGVHFGHQTRRWDPKMAPYIFGSKDKIHIIDLDKTLALLNDAEKIVESVVEKGGRVLFVGTKRQAADRVAEGAARCGQYFVNHRWLGGMLTNWKTVSQSIKKLEALEKRIQDKDINLKKKEVLNIERKIEKLNKALGGVRNMGGIPSLLVVLDVNVDKTAVKEARVLGIPVVGICDTNSDPTLVDYPIPGNDDSVRAIDLYCRIMENAVLEGIQKGLTSAGVDVGSLDHPISENMSDEGSEELSEADQK
jgi:small subunit ribosomal protein S2